MASSKLDKLLNLVSSTNDRLSKIESVQKQQQQQIQQLSEPQRQPKQPQNQIVGNDDDVLEIMTDTDSSSSSSSKKKVKQEQKAKAEKVPYLKSSPKVKPILKAIYNQHKQTSGSFRTHGEFALSLVPFALKEAAVNEWLKNLEQHDDV
jgi:hypothetical protein